MHISSFVNNIGDESLHSNKYAGGTVSLRSFAERQAIEKSRQVIGSYGRSKIASQTFSRERYVKPANRTSVQPATKPNRQAMNAKPVARTFREPPSRSYNPYA